MYAGMSNDPDRYGQMASDTERLGSQNISLLITTTIIISLCTARLL